MQRCRAFYERLFEIRVRGMLVERVKRVSSVLSSTLKFSVLRTLADEL